MTTISDILRGFGIGFVVVVFLAVVAGSSEDSDIETRRIAKKEAEMASAVFRDGANAARAGLPESANPYQYDYRVLWLRGYVNQRIESKKE